MFGAAFMNHDVNQKCPFVAMSSNTCETVIGGGIAAVFHHISAYQSFTEVWVSSWTNILVALMSVVLLLFIGILNPPRAYSSEINERICVQDRVFVSILNPILRWITLQNKRDTHLGLKLVVT